VTVQNQATTTPLHIAIIMDGNGRWAQQRHMPRKLGHYRGASRVRGLIEYCTSVGVQCVTLFAFSTENWQRPEDEVDALMGLFMEYLDKELPTILDNQVRFRVIGSLERFSLEMRQRIESIQELSAQNTGLMLNIAANYGGRWEILNAVQSWQASHPTQTLTSLTEDQLGDYLMTAGQPELDLLIRTGGESRISNFLLWQAAYAELYFTDILWPEFDESALKAAFEWFASRQRRFGAVQMIN
jgi:undecaprenyl diphosphate synthase